MPEYTVHAGRRKEWRQQADAILNQAAPVQNTWYTVLDYTGRYTWLKHVMLLVATANETLEAEVIINGITYPVAGLACTFGSGYALRFHTNPTWAYLEIAVGQFNLDLVGHNIRVRVRKTTATGAGNLIAKAVHAVM